MKVTGTWQGGAVRIYRTRPVEVEAMPVGQLFHTLRGWVTGDPVNLTEEWLDAVATGKIRPRSDIGIAVQTARGAMIAGWNDWIVRSPEGDFYPVNPDDFAKSYEDPLAEPISYQCAACLETFEWPPYVHADFSVQTTQGKVATAFEAEVCEECATTKDLYASYAMNIWEPDEDGISPVRIGYLAFWDPDTGVLKDRDE